MLLCYCTQTAPRVPVDYFKDNEPFDQQVWQWTIDWWEFTRPQTIVLKTDEYDRNRYELVEKKDWKIKELKRKLEQDKEIVKSYYELIERSNKSLVSINEQINDLEQQIKELEQ